jgi:hypothetical protein
MDALRPPVVDSCLGRRQIDSTGSSVGVVRLDPANSYVGIGGLLQRYLRDADQAAWNEIKNKIDYTYQSLHAALTPLGKETGLGDEIRNRLKTGRNLLFKPNLVNPSNIDPQTYAPDMGSAACTEWAFVAALMRWFHERLGVSYYCMALGEAATCTQGTARFYSTLNPHGMPLTTEAVYEGKAGDFYGGWGFYFVRKYLAESRAPGDDDDPMSGHEESVAGTYIPPGHVTNKLMVYDLNRICDDLTKGRKVDVPNGINFQSIMLHKVIVGGNPDDANDMEAYPGCILVNVPKMKVHSITLLTNVIKNLGIGLYPMQWASTGGCTWDYSVPHGPIAGMKGGIPHQVWVPEMDTAKGIPKRDEHGNYIVNRTGGITATMLDIIKAVKNQNIFMVHVVDAIEAINVDHTGMLPGVKEPEGMVFAGLDPVATDLLCARYMFSNVPLDEALEAELAQGTDCRFPQRVPVPVVKDTSIVTEVGYDCPLSRDNTFERAEEEGLGTREYHVTGEDIVSGHQLVSLLGHLGTVVDGAFTSLATPTFFFDAFKIPWDMQRTTFGYFEAVDKLEGSSLKSDFLVAFDEDGDGIVTYEEFGKKGLFGPMLHWGGRTVAGMDAGHFGFMCSIFTSRVFSLKCANPLWNEGGHDLLREANYGSVCLVAYRMSEMAVEMPDPFISGVTWGKGKWPSFRLAHYVLIGISLYGQQFPNAIGFPSLYGLVFRYADLTQNSGKYAGTIRREPYPEAVVNYIGDVSEGKARPLDFILYVPPTFELFAGSEVPNVQCTDDPARVLTVSFRNGEEVWPEIRL